MDRRRFVMLAGGGAAGLLTGKWLGAQTGGAQSQSAAAESAGRMLFGVDYYPDQTREALWEEDAVGMAKAGITNVRVAEFAWSLMEPREGMFDFEWLKRSVAMLDAHGIAAILGTPSAAPPPWLATRYPEILMVDENGVTLSPGTRRFTCPTNPTYRRLANTIATRMAETFHSTRGVIGWQIDNELTLGNHPRCYCPFCRKGFQDWLQARYGSLAELNRTWGTVFWSNVYTEFSQVPVPLPSGAPPNPGMALDYDRYQSAANVSFLEEQLALLRKVCPGQFVTTNNVGGLIDTIDLRELYKNLDFVSTDNYPGFIELFASETPGMSLPAEATAALVSFSHDFMRSMKDGKPFMVMEQQTGKAGQATFSAQPQPGQLRLWTYQAVAHGAMGVNYFRWDSARSGAEEYWHGMLNHDRTKSIGFAEIERTIAELKQLGGAALNATYKAGLALLYDYNADWALTIQPGQPKLKYFSEMMPWYGCMAATRAGIDIVDGTRDLSRYRVVCAPVMYIVTAEQARRIRAFVEGGGVFIAGVRLGVKDASSRIAATPLPGLLRDLMGVEVADYQPLYSAKQGVKFSGLLAGPNAECHVWADVLTAGEGTEVLGSYTGDHAGKAAITSHAFGKGKAVYVGAHLEPADLGRVLFTLIAASGVASEVPTLPQVEATVRQRGAERWLYLLNHSSEPVEVPLKGAYVELASKSAVAGPVRLEPYGVRVLGQG